LLDFYLRPFDKCRLRGIISARGKYRFSIPIRSGSDNIFAVSENTGEKLTNAMRTHFMDDIAKGLLEVIPSLNIQKRQDDLSKKFGD
jgi:hypothetical protein